MSNEPRYFSKENSSGHYSAAASCNGLVFVSGQLPALSDGSNDVEAPFTLQVTRSLDNLKAALELAGTSLGRVIKVNAYIVDAERWPEFNEAFAKYFGDVKPARCVVPLPHLHHGYLVEIEAVAAS